MSVVGEEKREEQLASPLDNLSLFLRDIRRYPLLNEQEERTLTLRCAGGDTDAIRILVCSNLRLVVNVARDYAERGVPMMDLVQEGSIGLLNAAKNFDPALGFRFSTYATKWIRSGVLRCLADHGAMIRVPGHTSEKLQKVLRVKAELAQHLGAEPSEEQLLKKLDMTADQLEHLMQKLPQVRSLDANASEDAELKEFLDESLSSPPQEQLVRDELARIMEVLLSQLTDRQRLIIRLSFGMEDGKCHSLESIGRRLEISKERVRQIRQQAMERLKKNGAAFGLEDFLNE